MEPESIHTGESTDWDDWWGVYHNHIPEVDQWAKYDDTDRIEMQILKYFNFDGRRIWKLATVWFDGSPIMIIQNAGREGDDHVARFITDRSGYYDMVRHIMTLRQPDEVEEGDDSEYIDIDAERPDLLEFYGNHYDGYFERYRY